MTKLLSRGLFTRKLKWALAILITILAFQSILQARANSTWNVQVVDPRGSGGKITIDSWDNPHIIYNVVSIIDDGLTTSLNYAYWTGTKWNIEHLNYTVGNIFIMDTNNNPHVISTSNGTLKDIPLTTPVWNLKDIGITEVAGDTMALDSSGTLHETSADYIYFESNNSYTAHLYYTTWTKSGESVQTICEVNSTAQVAYQRLYPQSIAVDSKGNPHIVFVEEHETVLYPKTAGSPFLTTNTIKYAMWTGSNWTIQTAASNASSTTGSIGNIVLDSKGNPHLCYIHENFTYLPDYGTFMVRDSLNYVYWDGSAWLVQAIDSKPDNIHYGQFGLKLDHNNNPIVYFYKENYQNTTDSGLIRANLIDSGWNLQTIGSHDFNGIAFDSGGNPHIVYDMWLGGSIRSVPIRSNLTYASLETTPVLTPTSLLITIIAVTTVVVVLAVLFLVYKIRRKGADKSAAQHVVSKP